MCVSSVNFERSYHCAHFSDNYTQKYIWIILHFIYVQASNDETRKSKTKKTNILHIFINIQNASQDAYQKVMYSPEERQNKYISIVIRTPMCIKQELRK